MSNPSDNHWTLATCKPDLRCIPLSSLDIDGNDDDGDEVDDDDVDNLTTLESFFCSSTAEDSFTLSSSISFTIFSITCRGNNNSNYTLCLPVFVLSLVVVS